MRSLSCVGQHTPRVHNRILGGAQAFLIVFLLAALFAGSGTANLALSIVGMIATGVSGGLGIALPSYLYREKHVRSLPDDYRPSLESLATGFSVLTFLLTTAQAILYGMTQEPATLGLVAFNAAYALATMVSRIASHATASATKKEFLPADGDVRVRAPAPANYGAV